MIKLNNIAKIVLLALFICAYSFEATGACIKDSRCPQEGWTYNPISNQCVKCPEKTTKTPTTVTNPNAPQDSTFCGTLGENNVFSTLISTGQKIFNRLRDLIYVVAGFGIIAIAVGGFFGNLNWKWLGAIVISLLVIASAGELLYLITGCKDYNGTLITNTLTTPSTSSSTGKTTK